ncbi:MAG: hypothetical protein QOI29_4602 [Mycobacterium sp.]|nr:hypothetical protein [Mycobacterium sp.]
MSVNRPFLTAEVARAKVCADLDAIDEALTRLRGTSTDLVGNAFRVEVVGRLETQLRILADAVEDGAVGEDHIKEICDALDVLPAAVAHHKDRAERTLVRHARRQDAAFVAAVGRRLADTLNPDGLFEDRDRMNRRSMSLGRQGPDGMSRLSGWITPETRAYLEALKAAVRPATTCPGAEQTVVDAVTDDRSGPQRLHDAFAWGLRTGIESGSLGAHRGIR